MGQNIFWDKKNNVEKKICVKKFWFKKNILVSKKFGVQKIKSETMTNN